jgi:hypothetical protein
MRSASFACCAVIVVTAFPGCRSHCVDSRSDLCESGKGSKSLSCPANSNVTNGNGKSELDGFNNATEIVSKTKKQIVALLAMKDSDALANRIIKEYEALERQKIVVRTLLGGLTKKNKWTDRDIDSVHTLLVDAYPPMPLYAASILVKADTRGAANLSLRREMLKGIKDVLDRNLDPRSMLSWHILQKAKASGWTADEYLEVGYSGSEGDVLVHAYEEARRRLLALRYLRQLLAAGSEYQEKVNSKF